MVRRLRAPSKVERQYADLFLGFTRLDRLHHIGSHSAYLAVDAYRIAIAEAKQGKNVKLYLLLVEELSQIAPNDPAALTDTAWAEKKTREVQQEQDRLDHELKSYKNNLIKESIRVRCSTFGYERLRAANRRYRWATKTWATSSTHAGTGALPTRLTCACGNTALRTSTSPT